MVQVERIGAHVVGRRLLTRRWSQRGQHPDALCRRPWSSAQAARVSCAARWARSAISNLDRTSLGTRPFAGERRSYAERRMGYRVLLCNSDMSESLRTRASEKRGDRTWNSCFRWKISGSFSWRRSGWRCAESVPGDPVGAKGRAGGAAADARETAGFPSWCVSIHERPPWPT